MNYYIYKLLKLNREIRKANNVTDLCWIINDIAVTESRIPLVNSKETKLYCMFVHLTAKAIAKVRLLKCTSY